MVQYTADVATSTFGTIVRLLWRWKGSIWKAVWLKLLCWCVLYGILSVTYRAILNDSAQKTFALFCGYCRDGIGRIPLDFMLGFYVTQVINRWLNYFNNLGTVDNLAMLTSNYIRGGDDYARNLRRNIARYAVLGQAIVLRDVNIRVRKRFPTMESLVAAGFMMEHELEKFGSVTTRYANYWMPFNWAVNLVNKARDTGMMRSDFDAVMLANEIRSFRALMTEIWKNDWVPLPLIYPQLIALAVHCYFLVELFGRQFIITDGVPDKDSADVVIPIITIMQFVFYFGWTEVAMALLNPMGEDDADFDCNFLLDRNLTVALTCVDQGHDDPPEVMRDIFWGADSVQPLYSLESVFTPVNLYEGSAVHIHEALHKGPEDELLMMPHPENKRRETEVSDRPRLATSVSVMSHLPPEIENTLIRRKPTTMFIKGIKRSISSVSRTQAPVRIEVDPCVDRPPPIPTTKSTHLEVPYTSYATRESTVPVPPVRKKKDAEQRKKKRVVVRGPSYDNPNKIETSDESEGSDETNEWRTENLRKKRNSSEPSPVSAEFIASQGRNKERRRRGLTHQQTISHSDGEERKWYGE